ncbi:MAG: hypothetical protein JST35_04860 [Armatimonadetes bacterium]|nr:hypothetical protein [Armatimonadota bacterium]
MTWESYRIGESPEWVTPYSRGSLEPWIETLDLRLASSKADEFAHHLDRMEPAEKSRWLWNIGYFATLDAKLAVALSMTRLGLKIASDHQLPIETLYCQSLLIWVYTRLGFQETARDNARFADPILEVGTEAERFRHWIRKGSLANLMGDAKFAQKCLLEADLKREGRCLADLQVLEFLRAETAFTSGEVERSTELYRDLVDELPNILAINFLALAPIRYARNLLQLKQEEGEILLKQGVLNALSLQQYGAARSGLAQLQDFYLRVGRMDDFAMVYAQRRELDPLYDVKKIESEATRILAQLDFSVA